MADFCIPMVWAKRLITDHFETLAFHSGESGTFAYLRDLMTGMTFKVTYGVQSNGLEDACFVALGTGQGV